MGRIMSVDYGRKRSGIAVTDPLKIIANGLTTVESHRIIPFITSYIESQAVELFVVGWPKNMANEPSDAAVYVQAFVKALRKAFPSIPIHLEDERFTSRLAFDAMIQGGLKKKARQDKSMVDKVSATIILQSYLDSKTR